MDPLLEQFEEGLDQVIRVLNYHTQVFLSKKDLSIPRYRILRYLQSRTEVNMSTMQNHLLVMGSTLTELVDGLVRSGLVERIRDKGDRRMVFLRLTDEGRDVYEEVLAFRCACLRKAMQNKESTLGDINVFLKGVYLGLKQQIMSDNSNRS